MVILLWVHSCTLMEVQWGLHLCYSWVVPITSIKGTLTISDNYKQPASYAWSINELHHKILVQKVRASMKWQSERQHDGLGKIMKANHCEGEETWLRGKGDPSNQLNCIIKLNFHFIYKAYVYMEIYLLIHFQRIWDSWGSARWAWDSVCGTLMCSRGPSTWAVFCHIPRCLSRTLAGKQSCRHWSWQSNPGGWRLMCWLYLPPLSVWCAWFPFDW